jgi:hypothetical protein
MRFAHHNVAMMFAAGMTIQQIEQRTGFTSRRLAKLLSDQTFCELIEHYRGPWVKECDDFDLDDLVKRFTDRLSDLQPAKMEVVDFADALDRAIERSKWGKH